MRIRRDLADAAQRGRPHGRKAYGYDREYDVRTGKLDRQVPHPEQAPVVVEIITRIAGGDAVAAIWRDLNERGVPGPTGGRWSRSTITHLVLDGVVYICKRRHNGGPLLDGDWPAIVDEDVYWRAVAVLSDPKRKPRGWWYPSGPGSLATLVHCDVRRMRRAALGPALAPRGFRADGVLPLCTARMRIRAR